MFVKVHHIPTPPAGGLLIYRGGKAKERNINEFSLPRTFWGFCFHTAIFRGKIRKHKHRPPKTIRLDWARTNGATIWKSVDLTLQFLRCCFLLMARPPSVVWLLQQELLLLLTEVELGLLPQRSWRTSTWGMKLDLLFPRTWLICVWVYSLASNDSLSMHRAFTFCKTFPPKSTQMKIFLFFTSSDYWFHFDFTSHSIFTASSTKS